MLKQGICRPGPTGPWAGYAPGRIAVGYIYSGESSPVLQLITWVPTHEMAKRGCPSTTYVNTLLRDTLL